MQTPAEPNAAGTFPPDDDRRVLDCPTCNRRMELIQLERFVGWWCPMCDPRPTTGTWPPAGSLPAEDVDAK